MRILPQEKKIKVANCDPDVNKARTVPEGTSKKGPEMKDSKYLLCH